MNFRKADTRTLWVFAIIAVFILVIILTGTWKRFAFFITFANFFGFEDAPPIGTSIIGVNMESDDLRFFTGEKWVKIKNDPEFVLDVYKFKPDEIKKELLKFYRDTPRKPEIFSIDVNRWSYWEAKVDPSRIRVYEGNDQHFKEEYFVRIDNKIKNGYEGPSEAIFGLGNANSLKEAFTETNKDMRQFDDNFLNLYYSEPLLKVIGWKESILEGGSCEKFAPLKLKFETSPLSFKQDSNNPENYFYKVQKIEEYLFVDLSKPVEAGQEEKYKDDCLKTEFNGDTNRPGVMNPAEIKIEFVDETGLQDIDTRITWTKFREGDSFSWGYSFKDYEQTSLSGIKIIDSPTLSLQDDTSGSVSSSGYKGPPKIFKIPGHKVYDFYEGFSFLTRHSSSNKPAPFNKKNQEANEIHAFINPTGESPSKYQEINLDNVLVTNTEPFFDTSRGLNNDLFVINRFVFTILDEYNKHLKSPVIFTPPYYPDMSEYFFVLEDRALVLMDNREVKQNVKIFANNIFLGSQFVGEVSLEGVISINYGWDNSAVLQGNSPALDFMNGKNVFDFSYSETKVYPKIFKKLGRADIPSSTLRTS